MSIYSTIDYLCSEGAQDGRQRGVRHGACRQGCKLLLRHGKRAFGPPSPQQRALLEALADHDDQTQLEQIQDRFLSVSGWDELLAGVGVPTGAPPADPEYLLPYEFNPTPLPPSIDEYCKVKTEDDQSYVIHLRFQRLYQKDLGAILYRDNERLRELYHCEVQSVVLMLWPGADGPGMNEKYQPPTGPVFRYHLTRLWEKDVEEMLHTTGTVALSPLARFASERLPEIVRRMGEYISALPDKEMASNLWYMAYSTMGLRYSADTVNELLAPVLPMLRTRPDGRACLSEGYYAGLSQGQTLGAVQATRRWVLALGGRRLGEAPAHLGPTLDTINQLERLEQLAARVLKVATWQEVLVLN